MRLGAFDSDMSLPRRALGLALLVVAAAALALAARLAPAVAPVNASGVPALIAPSPFSNAVTPALLAAGSVLLVTGVAALTGSALSARGALVAPALGALVALALGVRLSDPAVVFAANIDLAAVEAALSGPPGTVAVGALAGGAVAPVVRASTTGDTVALLAGAFLLLAGLSLAPTPRFALLAGLIGGGLAVGLAWALDAASWAP